MGSLTRRIRRNMCEAQYGTRKRLGSIRKESRKKAQQESQSKKSFQEFQDKTTKQNPYRKAIMNSTKNK